MASKTKLRYNTAPRRQLRAELMIAADFTCRACGWRPKRIPQHYDGSYTIVEDVNGKGRYLAIDHIKPRHVGGRNDRENLQVLCSSCNGSKGARC